MGLPLGIGAVTARIAGGAGGSGSFAGGALATNSGSAGDDVATGAAVDIDSGAIAVCSVGPSTDEAGEIDAGFGAAAKVAGGFR